MSKAVIDDYFRAYNAESAEALGRFYNSEVELHTAEGVLQGPDAILAVYQHIIAEFRDQMTPQRIDQLSQEFHVDILDTFTAKVPVADFMGRLFTAGETLSLRLQARYRLREGRIIRGDIDLAGGQER